MLPVVFVIRQDFSDLGQLVLQLSVREDLDTETEDHSLSCGTMRFCPSVNVPVTGTRPT